MGLSLSYGLGPVTERTQRQPARGNPAMLDARERETAGVDAVQKAGDASGRAKRCDLLAGKEAWSSRRVQACENTELQASEDRCNACMTSAGTLRPNVRAKR